MKCNTNIVKVLQWIRPQILLYYFGYLLQKNKKQIREYNQFALLNERYVVKLWPKWFFCKEKVKLIVQRIPNYTSIFVANGESDHLHYSNISRKMGVHLVKFTSSCSDSPWSSSCASLNHIKKLHWKHKIFNSKSLYRIPKCNVTQSWQLLKIK